MRTKMRVLVLLALAGLQLGAPASAEGITISLLPAGGAISGAPGETIGWGYSITNDTQQWMTFSSFNSDGFQHATTNTIFDFPIFSPGQTIEVPYSGAQSLGLFEITWDADAPPGFVNSGLFDLTADFYSSDLIDEETFMYSLERSVEYSATVVGSGPPPVPEPGTLALLSLGLLGLGFTARRRLH